MNNTCTPVPSLTPIEDEFADIAHYATLAHMSTKDKMERIQEALNKLKSLV